MKSARVGEDRRKKIHPCSRSRTLDAPVSAASFPSRRGRGKEKEREGCFLVVRGPGPGQQQAGQIKIWIAPKLQAMGWGSRLAAEGPAWRVASTCVGLAAWAPCSGRGQQQKPGKPPQCACQTGNFPSPPRRSIPDHFSHCRGRRGRLGRSGLRDSGSVFSAGRPEEINHDFWHIRLLCSFEALEHKNCDSLIRRWSVGDRSSKGTRQPPLRGNDQTARRRWCMYEVCPTVECQKRTHGGREISTGGAERHLKGHTTPSLCQSAPAWASQGMPPSCSLPANRLHQRPCMRQVSPDTRRPGVPQHPQVTACLKYQSVSADSIWWKGCTPGRVQVAGSRLGTGQADMMQYEGEAARCVRSNHADRIGPFLNCKGKGGSVRWVHCTELAVLRCLAARQINKSTTRAQLRPLPDDLRKRIAPTIPHSPSLGAVHGTSRYFPRIPAARPHDALLCKQA